MGLMCFVYTFNHFIRDNVFVLMLTISQLKNTYNAEQIALVLLTRLFFDTATKADVDDLIADSKINWTLLYKITRAHGVRPFIYYIIKQHNIKVPNVFEDRLQRQYDKSRRLNLQMGIATSKLIADLKAKSIMIIPYKGPVLAHNYYPDIALRESTDLDFLVDAKDVAEIEKYFIEKKYTPKTTVTNPYLKYYKKHFKDIVYRTPSEHESFSVEMHWRLMEKFSGNYPQYDFFIPNLEEYNMGGLKLYKLSPTYDMLAVVSNHFVKDMGIKFKYLVDVAAIINKEKHLINEALVFETATKYGFKKRLNIGLALTESLLGISLDKVEETTDHLKYLNVPLAFPIQLPRLYINEPGFIKRSLQLQDSNTNKLKFISKSIKYMFLPTYEDINQLKHPTGNASLLAITRPFRIIYRSIKNKKHRKL